MSLREQGAIEHQLMQMNLSFFERIRSVFRIVGHFFRYLKCQIKAIKAAYKLLQKLGGRKRILAFLFVLLGSGTYMLTIIYGISP